MQNPDFARGSPPSSSGRARQISLAVAGFCFAQVIGAEPVRAPGELKNLTLDELLETKVIAGTRTALSRKVKVDWTARYVGALPNPVVPAYWTLDLRVAFQPAKNWEIALVGQNLLEPSHPEFSAGTEVKRGGYAWFIYGF